MTNIRAINNMYDGAKTWVRTTEGDSKRFPIMMRLHQRSTLNRFLFLLVMDELTQHIQGKVRWCMLFAEDIELIYETRSKVFDRLEA